MKYLIRFHHGVSRCYCPSKEVAKRALVDGLGGSQIRVFGLPVRPSFPRTIICKVKLVQIIPLRVLVFQTLEDQPYVLQCFVRMI